MEHLKNTVSRLAPWVRSLRYNVIDLIGYGGAGILLANDRWASALAVLVATAATSAVLEHFTDKTDKPVAPRQTHMHRDCTEDQS